ncbi:hypothetical protein IAT40_005279 [Kwoniella sp. CBS 6097]
MDSLRPVSDLSDQTQHSYSQHHPSTNVCSDASSLHPSTLQPPPRAHSSSSVVTSDYRGLPASLQIGRPGASATYVASPSQVHSQQTRHAHGGNQQWRNAQHLSAQPSHSSAAINSQSGYTSKGAYSGAPSYPSNSGYGGQSGKGSASSSAAVVTGAVAGAGAIGAGALAEDAEDDPWFEATRDLTGRTVEAVPEMLSGATGKSLPAKILDAVRDDPPAPPPPPEVPDEDCGCCCGEEWCGGDCGEGCGAFLGIGMGFVGEICK